VITPNFACRNNTRHPQPKIYLKNHKQGRTTTTKFKGVLHAKTTQRVAQSKVGK
jgi:hypothetical protein